MPYYSVDITPDQTVAPCCKYLDRKTADTLGKDFFYSNYYQDIRNHIEQNKPIKGCSACYKDEENGNYSFRKYALEFYQKKFNKPFEIDNPKLNTISIPFSNLCNNKCRMCNSRFSTSWYQDEKALGWKIPKGQISRTDVIDKIDFKNVELISFLGGEPMMNQEKIIDILKDKCILDNLTVVITTNVTILPNQELHNLLKQCKRVEWDLSIDAFGELNDFLRKGSKWNETKEHVKWFVEHYENVRMQTAISIYNINCFHKLYEFSQQHNITHYMKLVSDVDAMLPRHMPKNLKLVMSGYVTGIKKRYNLPICDALLTELQQEGNTETFFKFDESLNKLRNEHWRHHNYDLYQSWEDLK